MTDSTKNHCRSAAFAINRSYQPTRIERELLAQVFELAVHGPTRECHDSAYEKQAHGEVSQSTLEDDLAAQRVSDPEHVREGKREFVA